MAYTHAKDYLIELAENSSTRGWLKDLIIKIINNNGDLSDDELTNIVSQIKANGASTLSLPSSTLSETHADLQFKSITHISGVCALSENQTIDFSDDITLLYGKNGSGKSSYYRVLNEIVGGNKETTIRPNIYSGVASPIRVNLTYIKGNEQHLLEWDGSARSISPLNLSSVFDSSYTSSFLKKRSTDNAIVLPYGLHLFTALTSAMDRAKEKLQNEIDTIKRALPIIRSNDLSEDVIRIVNQQAYRATQKRSIESLYNMSEEDKKQLQDKEDRLKELNESNFEDKIKIAKSEALLFSSLREYISNTQKELSIHHTDANTLIGQINSTRESVKIVKEKIAVLSEIGNTNSEDWNSFIQSGALYTEKSNISKNICPYCHQPLTQEATNLISAYKTYLSDKSQSDLNSLLTTKAEILRKISVLQDFAILEPLDLLLSSRSDGIELRDNIKKTLNQLKSWKLAIKNSLEQETLQNPQSEEESTQLVESLEKIETEYTTTISALNENLQQKEKNISALKTEMKPLKEKKSISEQKELFTDWFSKIDSIEELKRCQNELSTRNISNISKNASQTLITDNLRSKFQDELNALGLDKLRVEIKDAGASRGQSYSELTLANTNSVSEILSEGEQKGVALALFIAERRMQLSKNPIILDDPVNSLDNVIIAKLVERLCTLGNQIIIFSHNLLLLTSLENLKGIHICNVNQRSSCKSPSLHVYIYNVLSRGRDKKGVIVEKKQDNAKNGLTSAKKLLDNPTSDTDYISIAGILRHTIELMIDEKIFVNQIPVRFHGRKNSIAWDKLKELNPNKDLIDTLNRLYNRLSGGDLHSGIESTENPMEFEELQEIYSTLAGLV